MKILVGIKRTIDYTVHVRLKADHSDVETQHVKMSINPFDAIALEEAVRLKEKYQNMEIIAVSIGQKECQEALRQALALGADRAVLIEVEKDIEKLLFLNKLSLAKIFEPLVNTEKPDIVLLGKQAIDDDCNQTGQMLAGLLDWPQGTFISKLDYDPDTHTLQIMREIDDGQETLSLQLPAVITADLRLNEPRYPSLPNIMQAKRKLLEIIPFDSASLAIDNFLELIEMTEPPKRTPGVILSSVEDLVEKLYKDKVL